MKKTRKGFTLVELLIVIAIIGILSSMVMMSGQEATEAARATKIIDGFKVLSAAMMLYYSDNPTSNDRAVANDVLTGIKPYLLDNTIGESVIGGTTGAVGKYLITATNGAWWLTYTLPGANDEETRLGMILKNRAASLGLKNNSAANAGEYDGKNKACLKVR